jgi:hypothetical protein
MDEHQVSHETATVACDIIKNYNIPLTTMDVEEEIQVLEKCQFIKLC